MSTKAIDILADDRNYLSSSEVQNTKHTFVNSSKNLRQQMNDDRYSVNANRCKIFMDTMNGLRDNLIKQNLFNEVVYQCCSLHIVTRNLLSTSGFPIMICNYLLIH